MTEQPPSTHRPPEIATPLLRWDASADLPVAPEPYDADEAAESADSLVIEMRDDADPLARNRVAATLRMSLASSGKPLVLDLSSVPSSRLDAVLARWLRERSSPVRRSGATRSAGFAPRSDPGVRSGKDRLAELSTRMTP